MRGFAEVPEEKRFVLANAAVPSVLADHPALPVDADGLCVLDIVVADGIVERLDSPGLRLDLPALDLARSMVWPCFVDMHTHIDKGHIWPRRRNPDGSFMAALEAVAA